MKLKIDENLPSESLELLRVAGYDAITVVEEGLAGAEDAALAEVCKAEQRVFVTLDADFADIRSYPPKQFRGIVVLRLKRQDISSLLSLLRSLVKVFSSNSPDRQLWIVEEGRIRMRE